MGEEQYQTLMGINMKGVGLSSQAEARAMLAHGQGGSIVNIASMAGVIVNRGLMQVHYNASKAGVVHMSKSMAMEWVDRGIRVNSIHPGFILTSMGVPDGMDPSGVHSLLDSYTEKMTPMRRAGTPDDIAKLAVFLASDESGYSTGSEFVADGGLTAGYPSPGGE